MKQDDLTPAKALRMLIDIEKRERRRKERWDRLRKQKHVQSAALATVVGFVSAMADLGFIRWGPILTGEGSLIAVFVLFASGSLCVVGLLVLLIALLETTNA